MEECIAWSSSVFPRHAFCMWLATLEKFKTRALLERRGMSVGSTCLFCSQARETCKHLFFECGFAGTL